jgi:carboxyl-terminal processing protease
MILAKNLLVIPALALALAGAALSPALAQPDTVNRPERTTLTQEDRDRLLARMGRVINGVAFVPGVDFGRWNQMVSERRQELDKADTPAEFARVVNGALEQFGFSHIQLLTPDAVRMLREHRVVGIGIRVQPTERGIEISSVVPDSPAMLGGLREGETITKVDGRPAAVDLIRGTEGTEVVLTVLGTDGKEREVRLVRKAISTAQPETIAWPRPNVAVIRVPSFMGSYSGRNVERLFEEARKAELLVLDLRGNGGGAVVNLLHLAGLLLPHDRPMGTFVDRGVVERFVEETGGDSKDVVLIAGWSQQKLRPHQGRGQRFEGKVVGLIDGGSGSASEILAAALREVGGFKLIGAKTPGAVLGSTFAPLPLGFQLQFPINDYVTIKGQRLEGTGVRPDVEAPTPRRTGDEDLGLAEALRWFDAQKTASR